LFHLFSKASWPSQIDGPLLAMQTNSCMFISCVLAAIFSSRGP
jgi:hypothetical protein